MAHVILSGEWFWGFRSPFYELIFELVVVEAYKEISRIRFAL